MEDDRVYFISQLLDDDSNLWLAPQFCEIVKKVLIGLPIEVLQALTKRNLAFFAPDPNFLGRAMPLNAEPGWSVIYLAPQLLSEKHETIMAVIAHELAHVHLRHLERSVEASNSGALDEHEVDQLAAAWGFPLPESFTRRI
jgi:Zn-dependent protease with chaperone function